MLNFFINTAYAASANDVINKVADNIFNPIIAVMFGLALIMFLYGVLEFIQGGANEKAVEKGKQHIIYGILGLVIMVGVNGIIELIRATIQSFGN